MAKAARYAALPTDAPGADAWPTPEETRMALEVEAARKRHDEAQRVAAAPIKRAAALITICSRMDQGLQKWVHEPDTWRDYSINYSDQCWAFFCCSRTKLYAYLSISTETRTVDGELYRYDDIAEALNTYYHGTTCPYVFSSIVVMNGKDTGKTFIEVTYR